MKQHVHFIVTAGPTREYLDPVRFLSNPSTGRMGFAVARAARRAGHGVTLIAGPVALRTPQGVARVDVVSARDLLAAVQRVLASSTTGRPVCLVMTAAVADWRPADCAARKLKKGEMSGTLKLVRNPDILKTLNAALALAPRGQALATRSPLSTNEQIPLRNAGFNYFCTFGNMQDPPPTWLHDDIGTIRPLIAPPPHANIIKASRPIVPISTLTMLPL